MEPPQDPQPETLKTDRSSPSFSVPWSHLGILAFVFLIPTMGNGCQCTTTQHHYRFSMSTKEGCNYRSDFRRDSPDSPSPRQVETDEPPQSK
jgi:hypothetical protein